MKKKSQDKMIFKNIAILTSRGSWFVDYLQDFVNILNKKGMKCDLYSNHDKVDKKYDVMFILGYYKVIPKEKLIKNKHNIVVHESGLPKGRGWSPVAWQILEGKNKIPMVLFEASEKVDEGDIYLKENIFFEGHELCDEIRLKQAEKTVELCMRFINEYENLSPKKQVGKATFYKRRFARDNVLDINKTLKKQFNLLRIADNDNFPVFLNYKDRRYILKIYKDNNK